MNIDNLNFNLGHQVSRGLGAVDPHQLQQLHRVRRAAVVAATRGPESLEYTVIQTVRSTKSRRSPRSVSLAGGSGPGAAGRSASEQAWPGATALRGAGRAARGLPVARCRVRRRI